MLSLLAWVYGRGVVLRNWLYDKGLFDVHDLGASVISIGNMTVGGTGKSPLVAYVASLLAEQGETVCILTRGYGRRDENKRVLVSDGKSVLVDAATGGDEPVELAQKLIGKAIVIADADRVAAAEWAKRKFGVTTFVLDDGFQHRKAKRHLDIVCIDATDPFGGGKLLPAGRLREPVLGLARADVVVITRVEQVEAISDLRSQISDLALDARIFSCRTRLSRKRELTAEAQNLGDKARPRALKFLAFCGLGNPESFFSLLKREEINVVETRAFRDHHVYTRSDIDAIEGAGRNAGANALITTAKDAVKLAGLEFTLPCYVAEIELELDDPAGFAAMVTSS